MNLDANTAYIQMPIIGYVRSPLLEKFGAPRQPRLAEIPATIELLAPYDQPQAFDGLTGFSHIWLIWQFHQNKQQDDDSNTFRPLIRPPRLGGNDKIGVFASRSMYRPSRLGMSVVELLAVTIINNKASLSVRGIDMVDGTPIVDIKPYIAYADAVTHAQCGYAVAAPARLVVVWTDEARAQTNLLQQNARLSLDSLAQINALLALDPRPAYKADDGDLHYGMTYATFNIRFAVQDATIVVHSINEC